MNEYNNLMKDNKFKAFYNLKIFQNYSKLESVNYKSIAFFVVKENKYRV